MAFAYSIEDQQRLYFLTFTVAQWVDVFSCKDYATIILGSLRHCQQEKGLEIYGWIIMSNHIHLLARCRTGHNMSVFLRDFKKFTAKNIVAAIEANPQESRKGWLLWLLRKEGSIEFWQADNHAELVFSKAFFDQNLNYIHQNPVQAGYVHFAEDWAWSSAASKELVLAYWYE